MSVPSPSQTQTQTQTQTAKVPAPLTPSTQRRPATSRSIGFTPSSATDNDWRDRDMLSPQSGAGLGPGGGGAGGQSPSRSGHGGGGGGGASASPRGTGPGKTIGGFDKDKKAQGQGQDDAEKDKDGKTNLAHVPCRFFKQGQCQAGDSCPFSHSLPEPGKKEVCQWFLKGNCKFGHKCALAHVRPGEPMSMDRKNKKEQQREVREKEGGVATPDGKTRPSLPLGSSPDTNSMTSPVAIRSALSSSIQSPPASAGQGNNLAYSSFHSGSPQRHPSSPMREPFGPPSAGGVAGAGFGRSPGAGAFSSSPSRPSPLSASFSRAPGPLALGKSSATVAMHSPLRPPTSAAAGSTMYSSSFSHATLSNERTGYGPAPGQGYGPPLSASFADGGSGSLARNIWARSETPEEPLSPRRPILQFPRRSHEVFMDDDEEEDHGEDFLPASLNDLLTPIERARRKSRRDSHDSHGVSPGRPGYLLAPPSAAGAAHTQAPWGAQERLAQSAGANLGPANFLESLWSNTGADKRRENGDDGRSTLHVGLGSGGQSPSYPPGPGPARQSSLLTQQRTPSSGRFGLSPVKANGTGLETTFPLRHPPLPSSPSARAINEHAPGQSLPGGVATALSRLHMQDGNTSLKANAGGANSRVNPDGTPPTGTVPLPSAKREDIDDGFFDMDG